MNPKTVRLFEASSAPMNPTPRTEDKNATILIVDDNPDNRLLLSSQLGMHGYSILEADGGQAGLNKAKQHTKHTQHRK